MLSAEKLSVEKYQWKAVDKRLTTQLLKNGMLFSVCITEEEIMESQHQMLKNSLVIIVLIVLVFILMTIALIREIIKLAYTDVLSGLGNSTAYKECMDNINKQIMGGEKAAFSVVVIDINNLKLVNDNYGHEMGDMLIKDAVSVLRKVWHKNTFRIGGDEFAVVLMKADSEKVKNDIVLFEEEMEAFRKQSSGRVYYLQMAVGGAVYDAKTDGEYADVFRRADSIMYEDKKEKKLRNK